MPLMARHLWWLGDLQRDPPVQLLGFKKCYYPIQLVRYIPHRPSSYLVGGLEHFLFFHILGIIIPTDFHIFQRGRYTTNQLLYWRKPHSLLQIGGSSWTKFNHQEKTWCNDLRCWKPTGGGVLIYEQNSLYIIWYIYIYIYLGKL